MAMLIPLLLLSLLLSVQWLPLTSSSASPETTEKLFEFMARSYPTEVPEFPVRLYVDPHNPSKKPKAVSRGRFELLGGLPSRHSQSNQTKGTLKAFKHALQCSPDEPLDELYGGLSLMLMFPPTLKNLKRMCAWGETRRTQMGWNTLKKQVEQFSAGDFPRPDGEWQQDFQPIERFFLLRINKGQLYYDWPWGVDRIKKSSFEYSNLHYYPLLTLLGFVSDLGDSAFFFEGERAILPYNFPFPHFGQAGGYSPWGQQTNTMIWPWREEFTKEHDLYVQMQSLGDFSDEGEAKATHVYPWADKIPKAAFYASYDLPRWTMAETAGRHPDLFDVNFPQVDFLDTMCWSIECEVEYWKREEVQNMSANFMKNSGQVNLDIMQYSVQGKRYNPGEFKYLIVPPGLGVTSTSSRLLTVLAHCNCVVLLMGSHLHYHITPRLKPWVHYVPLSSIGTDAVSKVTWLRKNDQIAQRIAQNGHNFGKSYLRIEDYYCYAATAFETLAALMEGSDVLEPFDKRKIGK
ncbi:hypothetical protein B484DRAFT_457715 [Ochromonadaceae sp. CCMP2298]|nr:hypothetical protein B484DRAFT_457715 [Ochromonadaceae sp. CCMP2298]